MKEFIFSCFILFLISCKSKNDKPDRLAFEGNIDSTVKPVDDYFDYSNGGWIKKNPIPADESSWGIGYVVADEIQTRMKKINEDAAAYEGPDPIQKKIGTFWRVANDSAKIEAQGLQFIQPYLDTIRSCNDLPSIINAAAALQRIGVSTFFRSYVAQDDKISSKYALFLHQGGLGLPDRDYYFNQDSATVHIRTVYAQHVANMLALISGEKDSSYRQARSIFTFETRLAMYSRKLADLRDPYANYNKMSLSQFQTFNKAIDWKHFLTETGAGSADTVIVGQPEFFKSLDASIAATSIPVLKSYLTYHLISRYADALPDKFGVESFAYSKLLSGAKERKPRWKRVYNQEENALGELLGQLYVKKYFKEASKKRYEQMAQEITDAYRERMKDLTWMTDSTKQKAITKLNAINRKIGYPDKWKDFSTMQIGHESYVLNMINASRWWHSFNFNKLGKPVDKTEWSMYPQTYNAYYDPSNNEMVFPAAAFIVPGYNDEDLDEAVMYGYAGASYFGHEITHGFDDQGRLYDAAGNLNNWWTKQDSAAFAQRAKLIVEQFNNYEPLPGYHINGEATQGENIADLGGIEIGITAFKNSEAFKENKIINGFTPMQRFFMGYALSWLYEIRPERLRSQLMTDVHSPAKYRVNGPFGNVDEFYKVYNVQPGDGMYRPDSLRVRIW